MPHVRRPRPALASPLVLDRRMEGAGSCSRLEVSGQQAGPEARHSPRPQAIHADRRVPTAPRRRRHPVGVPDPGTIGSPRVSRLALGELRLAAADKPTVCIYLFGMIADVSQAIAPQRTQHRTPPSSFAPGGGCGACRDVRSRAASCAGGYGAVRELRRTRSGSLSIHVASPFEPGRARTSSPDRAELIARFLPVVNTAGPWTASVRASSW